MPPVLCPITGEANRFLLKLFNCSEEQISHCFSTFSSCIHCTHVCMLLGEIVIILTQSVLLLTVHSIGDFVASRS